MLTTSGAIIVHDGWRHSKIFQWPYKFMVNVHAVHVMYKVSRYDVACCVMVTHR